MNWSKSSPIASQPVEDPHAGQGPRARADREPEGHAREHGAAAEVAPAADGLGQRGVGQVGPDGDHGLDPEDDDQQRRHQRPAAHPGRTDEYPDPQAEEDDRRVHVRTGI